VRPFLPGQELKQSSIEFVGENGDLLIANPTKQGKEGHRIFNFNKAFGPSVTQGSSHLMGTVPLYI
jgi:kinesin family protein C2/C3